MVTQSPDQQPIPELDQQAETWAIALDDAIKTGKSYICLEYTAPASITFRHVKADNIKETGLIVLNT